MSRLPPGVSVHLVPSLHSFTNFNYSWMKQPFLMQPPRKAQKPHDFKPSNAQQAGQTSPAKYSSSSSSSAPSASSERASRPIKSLDPKPVLSYVERIAQLRAEMNSPHARISLPVATKLGEPLVPKLSLASVALASTLDSALSKLDSARYTEGGHAQGGYEDFVDPTLFDSENSNDEGVTVPKPTTDVLRPRVQVARLNAEVLRLRAELKEQKHQAAEAAEAIERLAGEFDTAVAAAAAVAAASKRDASPAGALVPVGAGAVPMSDCFARAVSSGAADLVGSLQLAPDPAQWSAVQAQAVVNQLLDLATLLTAVAQASQRSAAASVNKVRKGSVEAAVERRRRKEEDEKELAQYWATAHASSGASPQPKAAAAEHQNLPIQPSAGAGAGAGVGSGSGCIRCEATWEIL